MEIPSKVSIFNTTLEVKGKTGTLVAVNSEGFFEVTMELNQKNHTVLFPIAETVLIFTVANPEIEPGFDVER